MTGVQTCALPICAEWAEKADQLRLYSGAKYKLTEQVEAGGICAVTGLEHTFAGQGLGAEALAQTPMLEPVLTYRPGTIL